MKGKTTKTKTKFIVSLLMAFAMILSPITSLFNNFVWAADEITSVDGQELKVVGYEETVEFNEEYYLPTVNGQNYKTAIENGITYEVVQNNPNKTLTETTGDDKSGIYQSEVSGNPWCFKATSKRGYVLNIYVQQTGSVKTLLKSLKITVKTSDYTITPASNSEFVIPATIPSSITEIKIPRPVVKVEGEEIGTADYNNLKVLVNNSPATYDATLGCYKYSGLSAGKYDIVYIYSVNGVELKRANLQSFNVVDAKNYNLDDLKLKVEFSGEKPTTASIGKAVKLPSATAKDQNGDTINAYIEVKVKNETYGTDCTADFNKDTFEFTPSLDGTYRVTYQAKIALFGDKAVSDIAKGEFVIANVKDDIAPTPLAVKDYTLTENKITAINGEAVNSDATEEEILEALGNEKTRVANVVVIPNGQTKVVMDNFLPAIYASDNASEGYGAFTLTRKWRKSSAGNSNVGTTAWDSTGLKKVQDGEYVEGVYANNESASVIFSSTGTYSFAYVAKDEKGLETSTILFTVKVINESELGEYKTQPDLKVGNIVTEIYENQTLSFAKPIATDKNSTKLDSNIDVITKLEVYAEGETEAVKTLDVTDKDYNEKTEKYEIKISTIKALSELEGKTLSLLKLVVEAHNDIYNQTNLETSNRENALNRVEKEIKVLALNDTDAPEFAYVDGSLSAGLVSVNAELAGKTIKDNGLISGSDEYPFVQGSIINLPSVSFTDKDKNTTISINIVNENGNPIYLISDVDTNKTKTITRELIGGNYKLTVKDAKFEATFGGLYTVTYTAKDHYGNITTKSFGIRVDGSEVPSIIVADFPQTAELNEYFEYPELSLSDGTKLNSETATITLFPAEGFAGEESASGFTPDVTGTYVVEYKWGTDNVQKFFLEVEDTIAPVIEEDYSIGYFADHTFEKRYDYNKNAENIIYVPMFAVSDANNNMKEEFATIKITDPNGATITPTKHTELSAYSFIAEEGTYTVTYSAKDKAGNSAETVSFKIEVGNCNYPTISWTKSDSIPSTASLGKFTIPFADLIITDADASTNGDTNEALKALMENSSDAFTLTGPDGKTVENIYEGEGKGWVYDLTQTGDYKLTVVVRDNANHKTTKTYTINVPAESKDTTTNISNTVGTVLIVLSIVILGGVVVYFLFSTKKAPASNKKAKRK